MFGRSVTFFLGSILNYETVSKLLDLRILIGDVGWLSFLYCRSSFSSELMLLRYEMFFFSGASRIGRFMSEEFWDRSLMFLTEEIIEFRKLLS